MKFIEAMEVISEEYKTRSEDDGVFGILYEGYIKHEYQVLTMKPTNCLFVISICRSTN